MEIPVFRHKFCPDTIQELSRFASVHKYDDRKQFKRAWTEWIEQNQDLVQREKQRHEESQYTGDVVEKMFTSVRYYFRKKTEKETSPKARTYEKTDKEWRQFVDRHLAELFQRSHFKPSDGFRDFYEQNREKIQNEGMDKDRIKKTYKNRYYLFLHKSTGAGALNDDV